MTPTLPFRSLEHPVSSWLIASGARQVFAHRPMAGRRLARAKTS